MNRNVRLALTERLKLMISKVTKSKKDARVKRVLDTRSSSVISSLLYVRTTIDGCADHRWWVYCFSALKCRPELTGVYDLQSCQSHGTSPHKPPVKGEHVAPRLSCRRSHNSTHTHTPFKCQSYANKGQPVVRLSLTPTFTFTYSTVRTVVFPQKILIMIYKPRFALSTNQQRREAAEKLFRWLKEAQHCICPSCPPGVTECLLAVFRLGFRRWLKSINLFLHLLCHLHLAVTCITPDKEEESEAEKVNCAPPEQAWGIYYWLIHGFESN